MSLVMIRSVVRPEKADDVLLALMDAGFPGATKFFVAGRGKQRGLKIGDITYDELAKTMIMTVVSDKDKERIIKIIVDSARTGDLGNFGDGKIFISAVGEMYTISSGSREADLPCVEEVE
jgi:nitrogen regulatory protein PII 1